MGTNNKYKYNRLKSNIIITYRRHNILKADITIKYVLDNFLPKVLLVATSKIESEPEH